MRVAIRPRRVALASVAVAVPLWVACGASSPSGAAVNAANAAHAPAAVCSKILGVFSDGPDPDVDPVGYALSQILPLGKIHTSDRAVSSTLHSLIEDDRALVNSKGSDKAAKSGIKKADKSLNKACPGVAS
jgi:hypothetical protein